MSSIATHSLRRYRQPTFSRISSSRPFRRLWEGEESNKGRGKEEGGGGRERERERESLHVRHSVDIIQRVVSTI